MYPPEDSDDMDALRNGPAPAPTAAPARGALATDDIEAQVAAELTALQTPAAAPGRVRALDTDTECCT